MRIFSHHDAAALKQRLKKEARHGFRPLIVSDGFCPGCGRSAPIVDYLESARAFGGYLILDDTQALGILGHSPRPEAPYGRGGGGSLRWNNVGGSDVLLISSLAKGFGVPVAVLCGSQTLVQRFEAKSETRMHCSPPSIAVIHAAEHALTVNQKRGDVLRLRLTQLVRHFRQRLAKVGFSAVGGLFPVQTLAPVAKLDAKRLHEHLLRLGIRTVLHYGRHGYEARLSFIITALHSLADIDRAIDALAHIARKKNLNNTNFTLKKMSF